MVVGWSELKSEEWYSGKIQVAVHCGLVQVEESSWVHFVETFTITILKI